MEQIFKKNLNKSTNCPTGRANLFTLDFGKLLNWFKTKASEINQQISRHFVRGCFPESYDCSSELWI